MSDFRGRTEAEDRVEEETIAVANGRTQMSETRASSVGLRHCSGRHRVEGTCGLWH